MTFSLKSFAGAVLNTVAALAVCPLAVASANAATLSTPSGMAVDTAGNLYVANRTANTVNIYNTKFAFVAQISAGLNGPAAVAIAPTAKIYVANYAGGNVTSYSASLAQGPTVSDPNLTNPVGVFADSLAELWVLDAAGTAHAYLDTGTPIGSYGVAGATAFTPWEGSVAFWGSASQQSGSTTLTSFNAGEIVHGGPLSGVQELVRAARVGGAATDAIGQQYATDDVNSRFVILAANGKRSCDGADAISALWHRGRLAA